MHKSYRLPASLAISLALIMMTGVAYSAGLAGDARAYEPVGNQEVGRQSNVVLTSPEAIRAAQMTLRDRDYYNGAINGVMNQATRAAIRNFQRDGNLSLTGDLDLRTAQALGIADERGSQASLLQISTARAERLNNNAVRIYVEAQTRGGGWNVFADNYVNSNTNTLHVYVRGAAPLSPSTMAMTTERINQTIDDARNVTTVVFHGAGQDITFDLGQASGGSAPSDTGGTAAGDPRQIAFLANRLFTSYQRDLNLRTTRGQVVFDTSRNLRQNEVELLFQLHSLNAAAGLYNQMAASVTDPDAMKGAVDSLARQARLAYRLMRRSEAVALSSTVRSDWDLLRAELARLNVTEKDLQTDMDRIR